MTAHGARSPSVGRAPAATTWDVIIIGARIAGGHGQVVPDLGAHDVARLGPGFDAIRRGGGEGAPFVGPRQRAHHGPMRGRAATPAIRRGRRPAEGGVPRQPDDVAGRPRLLQQGEAEAPVEHQGVVGRAPLHRRAHQPPLVRAGRRVGRVRPHEGQREGQPLVADAAHAGDQPEGNRRQRLAHLGVVVAGRAAAQARVPEPGDVHRDRVVVPVRLRLPAPLRRHRRGPAALPQRRPGPAHRPVGQPARRQARHNRAPRAEQAPAHQHPEQMQQAQVRPERAPGHQATQQVHRAIDCLRHRAAPSVGTASAPALYQRHPPVATHSPKTRDVGCLADRSRQKRQLLLVAPCRNGMRHRTAVAGKPGRSAAPRLALSRFSPAGEQSDAR